MAGSPQALAEELAGQISQPDCLPAMPTVPRSIQKIFFWDSFIVLPCTIEGLASLRGGLLSCTVQSFLEGRFGRDLRLYDINHGVVDVGEV